MATSETNETDLEKKTFRNFALTWNNYPEGAEKILERILDNNENLRYIVAGRETAPETGTLHLQITIHYWNAVRFASVIKEFKKCHIDFCKKSLGKNIEYCKKDGDWFEIGDKPAQGRRTDLISTKRRFDAGATVAELWQEDNFYAPCTKYHKAFDRYTSIKRHAALVARGYVKPQCHVRLGPTGTGKSKWCDDTYGFCNYYEVALARDGKSVPWVDPDHVANPVWVFNDVGPNNIFPSEWFRRLVDGRPISCESKGGLVWCRPDTIVLTSNTEPGLWWPDLTPMDWEAIRERFTTVTCVEK